MKKTKILSLFISYLIILAIVAFFGDKLKDTLKIKIEYVLITLLALRELLHEFLYASIIQRVSYNKYLKIKDDFDALIIQKSQNRIAYENIINQINNLISQFGKDNSGDKYNQIVEFKNLLVKLKNKEIRKYSEIQN